MSPTAAWIFVGLIAVLVAVAVPVLLQLRRTLQTAERTIESTGKRVDAALTELTVTLGRVNRAAEQLERGSEKVTAVFDAIDKVRSSLASVAAIGASLGPMAVAAFRGFFGKEREAETPEVLEEKQ